MARKTFERKLYEWFKDNRDKISEESYNEYISFIANKYPDVLEEKKLGRPNADVYTFDFVIYHKFNGIEIGFQSDEIIEKLLGLSGDKPLEIAKLVISLMEENIIKGRWIDKKYYPENSFLGLAMQISEFKPNLIYDSFQKSLSGLIKNPQKYKIEERKKNQDAIKKIILESEKEFNQFIIRMAQTDLETKGEIAKTLNDLR